MPVTSQFLPPWHIRWPRLALSGSSRTSTDAPPAELKMTTRGLHRCGPPPSEPRCPGLRSACMIALRHPYRIRTSATITITKQEACRFRKIGSPWQYSKTFTEIHKKCPHIRIRSPEIGMPSRTRHLELHSGDHRGSRSVRETPVIPSVGRGAFARRSPGRST